MAIERIDQYPIHKGPLMAPLVDPETSATITLEELLAAPDPIINQAQVDASATRMIRQSMHMVRTQGLLKTTCEESRKTPAEKKAIQQKLRRKYGVGAAEFSPELSQFIIASKIIDPPPPSHDIGDVSLEDLDVLSRDPEVLEVLSESQLNSGTLVNPPQLEDGFHLIDLATESDDKEPTDEVDIDDLDLLLEPEEALEMETNRTVTNRAVITNPLEDKYDD